MKNNLKYKLSGVMFLASALMITSCDDWTDVESLQLNTPTFEEQNPQLYADYLKDLNRYKSEEHKVTFVSFENPQGAPGKQAERLTAIPDSVDFICLNNPENIDPEVQAEMVKIREKGTRTVYSIDYSNIESVWKEKQKADPDLTEEDALAYIGECTVTLLALCDKYNFDGIVVDYTGRSLVSLPEATLAQYNGRQQEFFGKIMDWQSQHDSKTLAFYGNIQYLVPENMEMLSKYDYIMLKTTFSTNADDLALKAYLAIQAGIDAVSGEEAGMNPVPVDRFIACVELPQPDDKDKVKGYWNTVDEAGNKLIAAPGAARWMVEESPNYTRKGIFIMNIQNDYYNNTYGYVREVIRIMNPNK